MKPNIKKEPFIEIKFLNNFVIEHINRKIKYNRSNIRHPKPKVFGPVLPL